MSTIKPIQNQANTYIPGTLGTESAKVAVSDNQFTNQPADNQSLSETLNSRGGITNPLQTKLAQNTSANSFIANNRSDISSTKNGLTANQRNTALALFDSFIQQPSFTNATGEQQKWLLKRMTTAFVDASRNTIDVPANKVNMPLWNTVSAVANGKINIGLYNSEIKGKTSYGYYAHGTNTININTNANGGGNTKYVDFIDTLAHETNHLLNDKRAQETNAGADRLWNEYRSFIVGRVAAGANPRGNTVHGILNTLTSSAYPKLRALYNQGGAFKNAVDAVRNNTKATQTFSVDQMRQTLNNLGLGSSYINTATNADNNLSDL
jgi:hypothetical protein